MGRVPVSITTSNWSFRVQDVSMSVVVRLGVGGGGNTGGGTAVKDTDSPPVMTCGPKKPPPLKMRPESGVAVTSRLKLTPCSVVTV